MFNPLALEDDDDDASDICEEGNVDSDEFSMDEERGG